MPDFSALINQLSSVLNATTVLTVMGAVVGATATIFLAVWGGRKIINAIQCVIYTGQIKLDSQREDYRQIHFSKYGYIPTDEYIDKHYLGR